MRAVHRKERWSLAVLAGNEPAWSQLLRHPRNSIGSDLDRSRGIICIVLAAAAAFGILGVSFVVAPRTGAALFGIPAELGPAEAYVL